MTIAMHPRLEKLWRQHVGESEEPDHLHAFIDAVSQAGLQEGWTTMAGLGNSSVTEPERSPGASDPGR